MLRIILFALIFVSSVLYGYFNYTKPKVESDRERQRQKVEASDSTRVERPLPIYQPYQLNPELVDEAVVGTEDHRILDFELVNQLGDTVTLADVENDILVVDFFFTRCGTICPKMTRNLQWVQSQLGSTDSVRILSHSVTPEADSVSVLYEYAKGYGTDPEVWWFLTGPKKHIYELSRKSYFACLDHGDGGAQDFVHTENVVLVDRLGRLRGFYDGTLREDMSQLVKDLERLGQEKAKKNP